MAHASRTAGRQALPTARVHLDVRIVNQRVHLSSLTSCTARGRTRAASAASSTVNEPPSPNGVLLAQDSVTTADNEVITPPMSDPNSLESLDDMAAFVERTRVEEENIRRRREEVELQLLRMRQQEAVRRQQAIKLRLATDRANAAVLRETSPLTGGGPEDGGGAQDGGAGAAPAAGPGPVAGAAAGPSPGPPGGGLPVGPPKKKIVLKKSKRLAAVAAAANLHRVEAPPTSPAGAAARGPGGAPAVGGGGAGKPAAGPGNGASGAAGKALLSREELIEKGKDGAAAAAPGGAESCEGECGFDEVVVPKPIFIISDCTGESAARTVRAALNQFEVRCRTQAPAQIMIYRFVESIDKMMDIIREAAKEDALVVYTLVDPKAVKAVQTACKLHKVRYVDLWTTLLDTMEVHLNAVRSGVPASLAETRKPTASLTEEYFRMIEAVEYTRKMDDGAHPAEWPNADLLVLGVSRCGKTPLSIYLGQRGYKVANLPLIPGCPVPRELYEIDQTRIVGLIIDPNVLATIRRNRVNVMGVSRAQPIDYAEIRKINAELEWARQLYNAHPEWPVIDVTLRGIEETAARILKMLNDRRGDASPKWVEAYHAKHQAAAPPPPFGAAAAAEDGPPSNIAEMIYGAHESTFLMQGLY